MVSYAVVLPRLFIEKMECNTNARPTDGTFCLDVINVSFPHFIG